MSRKKKAQPGGPNFWPGYVDALTNVVLNLVFMVGIFAVGLMAFGMRSGMLAMQTAALERDRPPAHTEGGPAVVLEGSTLRIDVKPVPAPELSGARVTAVDRNPQRTLATIGFQPNVVTLSSEAARGIWESVQAHIPPEATVTVWAITDVRDPVLRRAAYLRVMAVRDALRAAGVASARLEVRLVGGENSRPSDRDVYLAIPAVPATLGRADNANQ